MKRKHLLIRTLIRLCATMNIDAMTCFRCESVFSHSLQRTHCGCESSERGEESMDHCNHYWNWVPSSLLRETLSKHCSRHAKMLGFDQCKPNASAKKNQRKQSCEHREPYNLECVLVQEQMRIHSKQRNPKLNETNNAIERNTSVIITIEHFTIIKSSI